MDLDLKETLDLATAWALKAGEIHLSYFRKRDLDIHTKSTVYDVVTRADKEAEAFLISAIQARFPQHAVLGEETGEHAGASGWRWVIDPLDGTNNFSQGLPIFTVSIGLQYQGETVLGVVYAPCLREMYTALKGEGAFLNGQPVHVGNKSDLEHAVLGTGFPYDKGSNPDNNIANLATILPHLRGIRRMGTAAYDLSCTAAGWLDGYWELALNLWDVCAGVLIVEEAGGIVVPFRNDRGISIVAGNRTMVDLIRERIN